MDTAQHEGYAGAQVPAARASSASAGRRATEVAQRDIDGPGRRRRDGGDAGNRDGAIRVVAEDGPAFAPS